MIVKKFQGGGIDNDRKFKVDVVPHYRFGNDMVITNSGGCGDSSKRNMDTQFHK